MPTATSAAVHSTRSTNRTLITTRGQDNRWGRHGDGPHTSQMHDAAVAERITIDDKELTASR
jgi:hypothetical protein